MKTYLFSKTSLLSTVAGLVLSFPALSWSQIISPSAVEVKFSYQTTFEAPVTDPESSDEAQARFHAQHMFGIMHSAELVNQYGIESVTHGGIGAPRAQMKIKILKSEVRPDKVVITYANSGKMILNKKAAAPILKAGVLVLPLPANPYAIYKKKCTDPHYTSFGDYWYFYDPFREDCEKLSQAPLATNVDIKIEAFETKKIQTTARLPYLRADNGNEDLFSIFVIHGFSEGAKVKTDYGRVNFNEFDTYMREKDFAESREPSGSVVPLHVFKKQIRLDNGKTINVEVKHMLVETSIGSRTKAFAKFLKVAIENADVIIYGGHSGLGGDLDIPSLESKAGAFNFNPQKRQIFFFDSCSSYSYYLQTFAAEKTKAKIDVMTNGLSSYFETSQPVLGRFMDHLLTTSTEDISWSEILGDMENTLHGDSYLLNVGGI